MEDTSIKITNLSKTFYIQEDKKNRIRDWVIALFNQGKTKKFKALDDINLDVYKGEFLGVIGKNGSGKSTLLKLIAGIYEPDKGSRIDYAGRLVPFLELGVGFNMDLTGRENIYLNGTILGMDLHYLKSKVNDIIEFAELKDFIEMPVKNYSSGMIVRLAFSIAIQSDANIYLLDEVLTVGDENFQRKSAAVIEKFKQEGKTIIYITHNLASIVKYCDRVLLLDHGKMIKIGNPEEVVNEYEKLIQQNQVG